MTDVGRRQFSLLALLGGVGLLARSVCDLEGNLRPTPADPSVPEGGSVWITLPNGRTICRVCRNGNWVTAEPAA